MTEHVNDIVILISDQKLLKGRVVKTYPDGRVKAAFRHIACAPEEKIFLRDRYRYPQELCATVMTPKGKCYFVDQPLCALGIDSHDCMYRGTHVLDTALNHFKTAHNFHEHEGPKF